MSIYGSDLTKYGNIEKVFRRFYVLYIDYAKIIATLVLNQNNPVAPLCIWEMFYKAEKSLNGKVVRFYTALIESCSLP